MGTQHVREPLTLDCPLPAQFLTPYQQQRLLDHLCGRIATRGGVSAEGRVARIGVLSPPGKPCRRGSRAALARPGPPFERPLPPFPAGEARSRGNQSAILLGDGAPKPPAAAVRSSSSVDDCADNPYALLQARREDDVEATARGCQALLRAVRDAAVPPLLTGIRLL